MRVPLCWGLLLLTTISIGAVVSQPPPQPSLISNVSDGKCPPVDPNVNGICVEACNDADPSKKCQEGYKCCSNGCGHVCVPDLPVRNDSNFVEFRIFVVGLPWTEELWNQSSAKYLMIWTAIHTEFSKLGGSIRDIEFRDSYNCLEMFVQAMPEKDEGFLDVIENLAKNGIMIGDTRYKVNTRYCPRPEVSDGKCPPVDPNVTGICVEACNDADPSKKCQEGYKCCSNGCGHVCVPVKRPVDRPSYVEFTLYIVRLPWLYEYKSHSSAQYRMMWSVISMAFSKLGGQLLNIEMRRNYDCVEIFVQASPAFEEKLLQLIVNVVKNGIMVEDISYEVSAKPCKGEKGDSGYLEFKFFVANLPWTEEFNDRSSDYYLMMKTAVSNEFEELGGALINVELRQIYNCVEVFVQWNATQDVILDLLQRKTENGIMVKGLMYTVSTKSCPQPYDHFMELTIYVGRLQWSKEYNDTESQENTILKYEISRALSNISAVLISHEIKQNYDCLEVFLQIRHRNKSSVLDFLVNVTKQGVILGEVHYPVSLKPCDFEEASICDLTTNVCGENGNCTGNYLEWEICACQPGFGGLFCELPHSGKLTECQRMRRLMMFVHNQITGAQPQLKAMDVSMKEIMRRLQERRYTIPHCLPHSDATNGEFYSMCDYSSVTGQEIDCYCTDRYGDNNFWHYFHEDDCRVFTVANKNVSGVLYIHNLTWTDDLLDESSTLYSSIQSEIISHFFPAGGSLAMLKFSPGGGTRCVHVMITYLVENLDTGRRLMASLPGTMLYLENESPLLSLFPCKEEVDLLSCPPAQSNNLGTCAYQCADNDTMPCNSSLKCCKTSCGGSTCMEIGFLQKMNISITLKLPYQPVNDDGLYEDGELAALIVVDKISRIISSRYLTVLEVNRLEVPENLARANRKRRQARETYTTVLVEVKFVEEIDVDQLIQFTFDLSENGIDFNGTNYGVYKVALGKQGYSCGGQYCNYRSLCVENLGGMSQCACASGRVGSRCQTRSCHNADGQTLCQSNAACVFDPNSLDYLCDCAPGFQGEFCETNLCEMFEPNVCNGGTCVASLRDMKICDCPPNKGGLFCQYNVGQDYNQTRCEKHHALASYVQSIINGSNPNSKFSVNISQILPLFNATHGILMIPTCRYDVPDVPGAYHYFCGYDTETGHKSEYQDCLCVNFDGSPNYHTYQNGQCEVYVDNRTPCEKYPCSNGGICRNLPNDDFSCTCPPHYYGKTCDVPSIDRCPDGERPLMKSFGTWTCGTTRPCPVGFECYGDTRNGSCCFKNDFLCDLNVCKNGASCVGNVYTGDICDCPYGKGGMLCDINDDDNITLTRCNVKQRFYSWLISMLRYGSTPSGTTVTDVRNILAYTGMEYIPTNMCDENGLYKAKVTAVSILNVRDEREVCLDKFTGDIDSVCKDEICDEIADIGIEICKNGGRCVGDFQLGFCDCSGTGYHGILCDVPGVYDNMTNCTRARNLIRFAVGLIDGSIQLIPNLDLTSAVESLLETTNLPSLFEPYCDANGDFAFKGCAYSLPLLREKVCFCTGTDGQQVGDEQSLVEPPQNCPFGPDKENECKHEGDPGCKRPNWWCSEEIQCVAGEEKCYFAVDCDGERCSKTPEIHCIPTELKLPCEPVPCQHNKYMMCPPCGPEAECYHVNRKSGDDNDSADKDNDGKGDDNDSAEKNISWMQPKGRNYICECPVGRSGLNCEVYDGVCSTIATSLCPHGCIGDLENGKLCRCPEGFGGLLCNKIVRTPCQTKKALFDDSLDILKGRLSLQGYDDNELKELVRILVRLTDSDTIPEVKCTDNGFFNKVQCDVNIDDLNQRNCFCVNQSGDYISSNVLPHIGYDVCTGPFDFRQFMDTCFIQGVTICENGGACVFDLYEGKICSCPQGYYGQFCEKSGEPEDKPQSFCEFLHESYLYAQQMLRRGQQEAMNDTSSQIMFSIMTNFIGINSNRTRKGYPPSQVAMKMECTDDGEFKHYVCDHDLLSDERIACYCLGLNGPLIGTEAPNPDSLNCNGTDNAECHALDECPNLTCEHGFRYNLQYCPICECRHPCEGHKCDQDERCVVKPYDCDKFHGKRQCTWPVCVQKHKLGLCPGHRPGILNTISTESYRDDDQCQVKCHDDADCEGRMKCCGLCGNMCVEPTESEDCLEHVDMVMEYLEFVKETANFTFHSDMPVSLFRAVAHVSDVKQLWMPECRDTFYAPVQCMYNLTSLLMGSRYPIDCFCVDRLGHRINGSVGIPGNDSSCDVKPFMCPVLHPSVDDGATDECSEDRNCTKSDKCCFDGFHHVCAQPALTPKHTNVVDKTMEAMCTNCPSGDCMSKWDSQGIVCQCDTYQMESFCGMEVPAGVQSPRTACERKRLMTHLFIRNFQLQMTGHSYMINNTFERLLVENAMKLLEGTPYEMLKKMTTKMYECTDDGDYEPVQCDVNIFYDRKTECFCVNEQGMELPGTRTFNGELPKFCRNMSCPMGHALHKENGQLMMCSKADRCPYGYSCSRGMYGNLHCCPSKAEMKDICEHPVDVGFGCEKQTGRLRYFYNGDVKACQSFQFKGCGGNRNNYKTMEDCMKRCNDKMHLGVCPAIPFRVTKRQDCYQHKCGTDADCPSDKLKCCQSSCGKRCIPAIHESPAEGQCPVGPRKPGIEVCYSNYQCGDGFYCLREKEYPADGESTPGFCCLSYEDLDYCRVKPFMLNKEMDDDDDEEGGADSKPMDDDERPMGEREESRPDGDDMASRRTLCDQPMPRYYYNHQLKQCEMYYGCHTDFNSFETREDCCETCSDERRCKEGKCPQMTQDIVVSCKDECLNDYDCSGHQICCSTGCSLTCMDPYEESNSTCLSQLREAKHAIGKTEQDDCNNIAIPRCENNGDFSKQQCLPSFGICWCVTAKGNYLNSSLTRGVARCDRYSDIDMNFADRRPQSVKEVDLRVCQKGQEVHCCSENLCEKRCHAHPEAMCRINPCDGCSAEFYDSYNNLVSCNKGLSACNLELKNALKVISARAITARQEEEDEEMKEQERRRHGLSEDLLKNWGSVIYDNIPNKCQKVPETGNCKGFMPRWFFNPVTKKCSMFIWGMCGGNENRFRSPKECYDQCDPSSNPCAVVRCGTPTPVCKLVYDKDCYMNEAGCTVLANCTAEENVHHMNGIFVPRCLSSGAYSHKQCHGGFCWCVDNAGVYIGGLSVSAFYNNLQCTANGPTTDSSIQLPDCPAGAYTQKPRPECMKACNDKVCHGHPKAECVVDACSRTCQTTFVDEYGYAVNCEGDKCDTFSFDDDDRKDCDDKVVCDGNTKICPTDVCESAKAELCPKNPCAVCMVDSCTCQPYFVDAITSERIDHISRECKYLVKGACTIQTCQLKLKDIPDDQFPQCSSTGSFSAKQCHGSTCYCVEADGNFARNVSVSENCQEIDEIKKVELILVFNADFQRLKNEGKLHTIVEAIRRKLIEELGIPEENIKYISQPYQGSVMVDVVIADNKNDDSDDANIGVIANSISQRIQNDHFIIDVDGETLAAEKDKSVIALTPESLLNEDDDDDDGLSDKEIIIIAACSGGVVLLIIIAVACCCCCKNRKKPDVVDDTYDHIREPKPSEKNIYDNPSTLYNNKGFESEGHYMEVQDNERYQKVRL